MYRTLFTTTLLFALAALRVRADFAVDTVQLTQCQPATLNWAQTTGPYNVILVSSDQPCGDALVDLGDHPNNTVAWPKVNIAAGTQVMISILDDQDEEGWSGSITVQASDDKSCLTPASNPTPTPPTTPPKQATPSPSPTIVGAANAGMFNGASTLHFSGAAIVVTALGALAALL